MLFKCLRKPKNILLIIFALVILSFVVLPIFTNYVPGTADGLAHKFRLVGFHKSISEGYVRPRWLSTSAMGFGSPVFIFNYSLPYYFIDAFYRIGFSINKSTQIVEALSLILSFSFMFLLIKKIWGSSAALVGSAVYTLAPYHLLSIYIYESWGETMAFIFPPLVSYLLIRLLEEKNSFKKTLFLLLSTLSWTLLIFSHNISALLFSPIIVVLSLVFSKINIKNSLTVLVAFITSIYLAGFFWLPSVLLNYQTFYPTLIAWDSSHRPLFYKSISLLWQVGQDTVKKGTASFLDFTLGLAIFLTILLVVLTPLKILIKKIILKSGEGLIFSKNKGILFVSIIFFLSLFLVNSYSEVIWKIFPVNFVVYPLRFLFPVVFSASLLASWISRKNVLLQILFIVLALISAKPFTNPRIDHFLFEDSYFQSMQPTRTAPGTWMNMASAEFLPITADKLFIFKVEDLYWSTGKMPDKIIADKDVKIIDYTEKSEDIFFKINTPKKTVITLSKLYFPNWKALANGKEIDVERDKEGRIVLNIEPGEATISLFFEISPVERIGVALSLFGVGLLIFQIFLIKYKKY